MRSTELPTDRGRGRLLLVNADVEPAWTPTVDFPGGERAYACKRCGRVYRKRRSLTGGGYCRDGCGADAAEEWNLTVRALAQLRKEGGTP